MARGWVAGVVLVALGLKGYALGYSFRGRPLRSVSRVCEGKGEGRIKEDKKGEKNGTSRMGDGEREGRSDRK